ncbi:DUF3800 domain-containing protein [Planktotalea sp.]|uniref:DUF3800 domain-containing protein n=1 Tax=Planktotalea sp. TaxID=2029877 RepID=UPI003D6B664A
MKCTVFIDESGETGIGKIRENGKRGASPYFVLAAAVMPSAIQIVARKLLKQVQDEIPKNWKHATDLNHRQTVFFCRAAATVNMRIFAVVSKKSTLKGYSEQIEHDSHKFYNKCTQYLLECVGQYLKGKGLFSSDPDVIFEGRNHNFDTLRRFIGSVKEKPLNPRAQFLECFNPFGFVERAKDEEDLLKFADLAAHAVYQCVNKTGNNFNIPEARYIVELQSRFGADENGKVLGYGLKCIHSLEEVDVDKDIQNTWKSLSAKPRVRQPN